jgi:hypothetical protein
MFLYRLWPTGVGTNWNLQHNLREATTVGVGPQTSYVLWAQQVAGQQDVYCGHTVWVLEQFVWDLWLTEGHWCMFLSEHLGLPCPYCPTIAVCSYIALPPKLYDLNNWHRRSIRLFKKDVAGSSCGLCDVWMLPGCMDCTQPVTRCSRTDRAVAGYNSNMLWLHKELIGAVTDQCMTM